jgi:hypothetical protein
LIKPSNNPQNLGEEEAAGLREAVRKGKEALEVRRVFLLLWGMRIDRPMDRGM